MVATSITIVKKKRSPAKYTNFDSINRDSDNSRRDINFRRCETRRSTNPKKVMRESPFLLVRYIVPARKTM